MATTPYPLPRSVRRTAIMAGDGRPGGYGPFGDGWGIFDTADVTVYTKPAGALSFTPVTGVTITKTSPWADYSSFTVLFATPLSATTSWYAQGERTAERSVAVTRGGTMQADALEKELTKNSLTDQELRRDIGTAQSEIVDIQSDIADLEDYELRAEAAATAAEAAEAAAQGWASIATVGLSIVGMAVLAVNIASTTFLPTVKAIETAGYSVAGRGKARYLQDPAVDATFVALHPGWSFVSANGLGFRLDPTSRICIDQLGADWTTMRGDAGAAAAAAQNNAAFNAMMDCVIWYRVNVVGSPATDRTKISYMGVPHMWFGVGNYYLGGYTLHVSEGQHHIYGFGQGNTNCQGAATQLQWDGTCHGTIFHEWKEAGVPGRISDNYPSSSNSVLEGICFDGGGGNLSLSNIGVWCVSNSVRVKNCGFYDWASVGLNIGSPVSNPSMGTGANLCFAEKCNFRYCGFAGLYCDGADSNAGASKDCSFIYCGYYGIFDSSFLANSHSNIHCRGIGHSSYAGTSTQKVGAVAPCFVSMNGMYWHVMPGKAALASTTQPGNDNKVWRPFFSYTTVDLTYAPAWVSGTTYHETAPWMNDNLNAPVIFFSGYHEGDCAAPSHSTRGMTIQGLNQAAEGDAGGNIAMGSGALLNRSGGVGTSWRKYDPAVSNGTVPADTVTVQLGNNPTNGDILSILGTLYFPTTSRLRFSTDRKDIVFDYANSASNAAFTYTGPNTAQQFGSAAARLYHTYIPKLVAGTVGRRIEVAAAAPSSGEWARGDIIFNSSAAAAGKIGWSCTTGGTAGSTAVFKPFGAIDA